MKTISLLEKLRSIDRVDEVPNGWKTCIQLQEEWQCSQAWAAQLLRKGLASGIVEVKSFRIRMPAGYTRPVPHYREKPEKVAARRDSL
jgi:hypothetical protein